MNLVKTTKKIHAFYLAKLFRQNSQGINTPYVLCQSIFDELIINNTNSKVIITFQIDNLLTL
jgi:hypothetical protein